jgi:uncharacterized protein YqjF (DUF2071 family)
MTAPEKIDRLNQRQRPGGLPLMRQNWGKLLFLHWAISAELLRPLIPPRLTIDTFEGRAWIGVVPFTMWDVRMYFAPAMPRVSAFHELNVRTYVHLDGVPGVWFMSLDANSALAVWGARRFYHLPYFNARMNLQKQNQTIIYDSHRTHVDAPSADFQATWTFDESLPVSESDSLTFFLTERYCLYAAHRDKMYRCRIYHQTWALRRAELSSYQSTMIESHGLPTPHGEPLLHYADALKVDIYPLVRV